MSIVDDLIRLAQSSNINPRIFLSVAQVESSFNTNAVGDHGTSFGLFQLHRGGQAPDNVSNQQLLDPNTNARLAVPGIQNGLKAAGPFQNTREWWQRFASTSGHPGGTLTQASAEASMLQAAYNGNSFDAPVTGESPQSAAGNTQGWDGVASFLSDLGLELLVFTVAIVVIIVAIYFFVR